MIGTSTRLIAAIAALALCSGTAEAKEPAEKVGVVFAVHGGFDRYSDLNVFDTAIQQFSYDPNSMVYRFIWNPMYWGAIVTSPDSKKQAGKYRWEYERLGGIDPFHQIVDQQVADLQKALHPIGERNNVQFEVEMAGWMVAGDYIRNYPYPRFIYTSPSNPALKMTYCGEKEPGATGPWPGCNPERYNVDGPFERLAAKGVSRIFVVDLTVGGVRFVKTFQVYQMGKRALADWSARNAAPAIPVSWLNDPNDLLVRSYPVAPANWTASLGMPAQDVSVPLEGNPNPISEDPDLVRANTDGIAAAFHPAVPLAKTGIVLLNHAMTPNNEVFDPKIDDTMVLDAAIEADLLKRYPELDPENIVGAFVGRRDFNPVNGKVEPTREMRGDENGDNYLYERFPKQEPAAPYGYRYWQALQVLLDRGVEHIVVGFPQISAESVLNLVEVPNQIAKEVGFKNWRPLDAELSYFPAYGDPFADYWGVWVDTLCGGVPCCFVMGGCADGRPYPAPRQTPLTKACSALDPSMAWDVSEYGHLGYDPAAGPPNPAQPVQSQYRGTWSMYRPPNNDHKLIKMMARHVEDAVRKAGLGSKAD